MSQTDRIARISILLGQHRVVSRRMLLDTLEISVATPKRDIAFLRDAVDIFIAWDCELGGGASHQNVRGRLRAHAGISSSAACRKQTAATCWKCRVRITVKLIVDMLKHGARCKMPEPEGLRQMVAEIAGKHEKSKSWGMHPVMSDRSEMDADDIAGRAQ